MSLLSAIIWTPIAAGFFILLNAVFGLKTAYFKYFAILVSLFTSGLSCYALSIFDTSIWQMQFIEQARWLPDLGIEYALGIDGFSLLLVLLTVFMNLLVLIACGSNVAEEKIAAYCAAFLIMQGLMCGVFLATDAVLFYIFFEAMMIPMFLIIGLWGGSNRIYATMMFILYTFLGSLLLLVSILYMHHVLIKSGYNGTDAFSIMSFQELKLSLSEQKWLFWALFIAFAIYKITTWRMTCIFNKPTSKLISQLSKLF